MNYNFKRWPWPFFRYLPRGGWRDSRETDVCEDWVQLLPGLVPRQGQELFDLPNLQTETRSQV